MAAISNQCKTMAKELNVPVVALSQLNRECEKRGAGEGKKPILADLRDSGAIEQDADVVIFVHRPEKYGEVVTSEETGDVVENAGMLIVSKHRSGGLGDVKFTHNGSLTEFYDWGHHRNAGTFYKSNEKPF
jgi:replicative DNA helicase